ncbi:hypothetical protein E2C01_000878 [Portunus trituberculatus]|uniref:Uncharacterized protein n=1 Tax=Portunus trituberculatus TaxID=210409 RepID=A0A5B7CFT6_PORTR|nr:hypothetical protein [Portunus trituberculatus]
MRNTERFRFAFVIREVKVMLEKALWRMRDVGTWRDDGIERTEGDGGGRWKRMKNKSIKERREVFKAHSFTALITPCCDTKNCRRGSSRKYIKEIKAEKLG